MESLRGGQRGEGRHEGCGMPRSRRVVWERDMGQSKERGAECRVGGEG